MKKLFPISMLVIAFAVLLATIGCNNDDPTSSENTTTSAIARVYPTDGSTGMATSVKASIVFTGPVDTISIMGNFHLVGGAEMHAWRDSLEHSGGWGMMGMGQQSDMMGWIDSIHTVGNFRWNSSRDSCEFTPTAPLYSNTDYICVLNESGMRDHQGGMMGGIEHKDHGLHIFGFSTGAGSSGAPRLVSVIPSDGSTGVSLVSALTMVFDMPMDTSTVMINFHLAGGDDMRMWMDSLDHHMGMGGMGMMDMDHMMDWMDSIQHNGTFHWNGGMDTCVFVLDSTMMPNTDYMMFMNGDVHSYMGEKMNMSQLQYDGHMSQFTTGD